MATKEKNRVTFYSSRHGYVQLVKRSVGYYTENIGRFQPIYKFGLCVGSEYVSETIKYWRGQLVKDWHGQIEDTGEKWDLYKGQVVWLNAANFTQIDEHDYLQYTETPTNE